MLNSDVADVADADSDAYTVPSHHSSHPTVVEELGVEVHSTSSLEKRTFLGAFTCPQFLWRPEAVHHLVNCPTR